MPKAGLTTRIENTILQVRGQRVILDFQLAELYGVETRTLKQAVRRNLDRFPDDFMFDLTDGEIANLKSQTVISRSHGGSRHGFLAFTEQGVAMLSSVLRSPQAIEVNISIMRAFVRLRELLASNAELSKKLDAIEKKYDGQFRIVFDAIRQLMAPSPKSSKEMGFHTISDTKKPTKRK